MCFVSLVWLAFSAGAQSVMVKEARFSVGDSPEWKAPRFDDSGWKTLSLDKTWDDQGISNDDSYAWYRIHVTIPSSIKNGAAFPDKVLLALGSIDDSDETFLNGKLVGKTGRTPEDEGGYER